MAASARTFLPNVSARLLVRAGARYEWELGCYSLPNTPGCVAQGNRKSVNIIDGHCYGHNLEAECRMVP